MEKGNADKLFTIGEMVKACRTTKDTLYFYERKGLIKPAFIDTNGYRYYDLNNFYRMDVISMLREADSSINEIAEFLKDVRPDSYISYMSAKKEFFRRKRREYELLEEKLQRSIELTHQCFEIADFDPKVEHESQEYLILQECPDYENDRENILAFSRTREICHDHNIPHDIHQSAMISYERLTGNGENRFENDYYYALSYEPISGEYVHIKPEGDYVTLIHKGPYPEIRSSYEKALAYMEDQRLVIDGNSYEKTIVGWFNCSIPEDYITKISIKIKNR